MYIYNTDTGEFRGHAMDPSLYPECTTTDVEPPEHDWETQRLFFVNGAWEIRDAE